MEKSTWEIPNHKVLELKKKSSEYCVCIPVINEGNRIRQQLQKINKHKIKYDVIILDGGSTDGSLEESFLKENGVKALLVKDDVGKLGV